MRPLSPSLCCCVLFTAAFLLQSFYPLPLLVILAPFILFYVFIYFPYRIKAHDEAKFLVAQMARLCDVSTFRLSGPAGHYDAMWSISTASHTNE